MIHKLIHKWIYTGVRRKWIDKEASDECPFCYSREDYEHVLVCPKNRKRKIWASCEKILKYKKTVPVIIKCLWECVCGRNPQLIRTTCQLDILINDAIRDQIDIGVEHVRCGRISRSWMIGQAYYINVTRKVSRGTAWNKSCISALLSYSMEIWQERNDEIHAAVSPNNYKRKMVEDQIQKEYARKELWSHDTTSVFDSISLSSILERSTSQMKQWLHTLGLVKKYIRKK